MKLRARFPQIGQALQPSAAPAARGVLRRALFPTTHSDAGLLPLPLAAVEPLPESAAMPPSGPMPVYAVPLQGDWASTVAAWRSTTGLNGERP